MLTIQTQHVLKYKNTNRTSPSTKSTQIETSYSRKTKIPITETQPKRVHMLKPKINQNTIKQKKIIFGHGSKKNKAKRDNFLRHFSFIDSKSSNLKQRETQSSDLLQREIEKGNKNEQNSKNNEQNHIFLQTNLYSIGGKVGSTTWVGIFWISDDIDRWQNERRIERVLRLT